MLRGGTTELWILVYSTLCNGVCDVTVQSGEYTEKYDEKEFLCKGVSMGHFSSLDADRHSVWRFPSHFPLFLFVYLLFISVHHLFTGTLQQWTVSVNMKYWIQWNLPIVGMLETSVLSISSQCSYVEMYGNMAIYWAGGEKYVHCREVVHSSKCPLSEVPLLLASKCRTTNTVPCAKYPTEGSPYFRGVLRKRFHCIPSFICFPLTFQVWWDYIRPAPLNYRGINSQKKGTSQRMNV